MTGISTVNGSAGTSALISGELVDLLIESVVFAQGPVDRAEVISGIVDEVRAAIERLPGTELTLDSASPEMASLQHVISASHDHRRRMQALGPDMEAGGRK